jgi:uncharacterized protein (TIGR03067 family)
MKLHLAGTVVVALGLLFSTGCASSPKATETKAAETKVTEPAPSKDDLSRMQGSWVGHEVGGNSGGEYRLTVNGSQLKFRAAGPDEWYTGKLTLHPNTTPKQAEVLIEDCCVPQYIKETAKAAYKVEGNTLTISAGEPGSETTPTDLEPGNAVRVFTFTRQ